MNKTNFFNPVYKHVSVKDFDFSIFKELTDLNLLRIDNPITFDDDVKRLGR